MPVQRLDCQWPTCLVDRGLLALVGRSGNIFTYCPFHHQWVLRLINEEGQGLMPVTQRENPTSLIDIVNHPFLVWCDVEKCNFQVAAKTYEEGVAIYGVHKCPYIGGETKVRAYVSRNRVDDAWGKLDTAVTELIEGNYPPVTTIVSADDDGGGVNQTEVEHPEKTRLKGVCRGMAELLAIFMEPNFTTADQISAEAKRRYDARKAGDTAYVTPGLAPHTFGKPMDPAQKAANAKRPVPVQERNPAPSPVHKFTEDEVGSIKFAHESGMFTAEQLAKTYKVKVDVINKVLNG